MLCLFITYFLSLNVTNFSSATLLLNNGSEDLLRMHIINSIPSCKHNKGYKPLQIKKNYIYPKYFVLLFDYNIYEDSLSSAVRPSTGADIGPSPSALKAFTANAYLVWGTSPPTPTLTEEPMVPL